eukprot:8378616-Ditylum_brightwellii.AAC.1
MKDLVLEEDGEVGASSLLRKKPVSSEENKCKGYFLGGKEHGIEEDGKVRASSLLCKKPVSSEENTCKDHFLEVKEL